MAAECKHDHLRRVDWRWGRWECIDCGTWVDDVEVDR